MNKNHLALPAIALLVCTSVANADASVSTGIEYASGSYGGTDDIEDLYVPVSFRFYNSRFGAAVTIPYVSVTAPAGTVIGPDGEPLPGSGDTTTESGLGDISASLTLFDAFYSPDLDVALDLTGAVKFGTADLDKGLGTGEPDVTVYLDGYKWFDTFTLTGSVGYRWRGEPEGVVFDDVLLASLGGIWQTSDRTLLGLMFNYRQSAIVDADDIQEFTAFGSFQLSDHWYLDLYAFSGFTDSSPDWGGGLAIATDFAPRVAHDNR